MKKEILHLERVKELRVKNGLSQAQIADILNINKTAYIRYERGESKYPLKVIISLAIFYNTSVDYLINATNDPIPHKRKNTIK